MGLLITKEDFTGLYAIPQDNFNSKLDEVISEYEELYLIKLLGATLFDLFKEDVDSTSKEPDTQKYKDIFEAFHRDSDSCILISNGMKKMLIQFIFCEYSSNNQFKQALTGNTMNAPEISKMAEFNYSNYYKFYNEAVRTYGAIQSYIEDKSSDYPDFNGQLMSLNYWI